MTFTPVQWRSPFRGAGESAVALLFAPLRLGLSVPCHLFLATLGVMLLRPPDVQYFSLDRVALGLLTGFVVLRAVVLRQSLLPTSKLVWPMAVLALLAFADLASSPFDVSLWSVAIAKFVTPYAMFCLAGLVFDSEIAVRRLETFSLVVLAYLIFTAIASLVGWNSLVFPRFILDDNLGIHAGRARGPFLEAMANGAAITLLGLIAIDAYQRGRLRGLWAAILLGSLPIAILATRTRAVWLSFSGALLVLLFTTASRRIRRLCLGLIACALLAVVGLVSCSGDASYGVQDRLTDRGTAEFRLAAYRAGVEMFLERPLMGWGARDSRIAIESRMDGFRGNQTAVHNTYLEILIEHGLIGFALYAWIMVGLFQLGRGESPPSQEACSQLPHRTLWALILGVYCVNACFVVMNYQFVNGLLFTWGGILARQRNLEAVYD